MAPEVIDRHYMKNDDDDDDLEEKRIFPELQPMSLRSRSFYGRCIQENIRTQS